jgi:hypothetical protein
VRLPFKATPPIPIGGTFKGALKLHFNLEKRLESRSRVADQYKKFLHEYELLGHMIAVDDNEPTAYPPVFIPHHFVLRESSATTKLRVVFNAS